MDIYKITNTITEDFYVGKTGVGIDKRFRKHCYNSNNGVITFLYNAMRKYGELNFSIEIIESNIPKSIIDDRETYWITSLKPKYNMTTGGEGGDTSSSPKFKQSMKEYHSRKPREEYVTNGFKGKKLSLEAKEKISKSKRKRVVVEGIEFASQKEAKEYLTKIGKPTKNLLKRINSKYWPNYYRIDEKRVYSKKLVTHQEL